MPKANTATLQNQAATKRGRGTQATMKKVKIENNNSPTKNAEGGANSAATETGTEMPTAEEAVDKVFYVQELIGKRICNGVVQYKIRWVGYGEEDDTWEYIDNCHCPDAIEKFEEKNADLVPEQIEIDDMMKKRQSTSQGRKLKKRGRKSKITTTETEVATNLDEAVEFVPFVEKEHYRVMDEDAVVSQIIGMRQMGNVDVVGAEKKVMALVVYAEDGIHEYVPLEELRKNPSGIQLLIDFFIVRMQMIG